MVGKAWYSGGGVTPVGVSSCPSLGTTITHTRLTPPPALWFRIELRKPIIQCFVKKAVFILMAKPEARVRRGRREVVKDRARRPTHRLQGTRPPGGGALSARGRRSSTIPRGGGTQVWIGTNCQTAARSGSGERQNSGAVNSFWGKKGGRSTSN